MRRRRFLRTTAGIAGLSGLGATGLGLATADGRGPDGADAATTTTTGTPAGDSFGPMGSVPIQKATEAVVNDAGTHAFVAKTDGFAVVDVTDPADPGVVATREQILIDETDDGMQVVYDVKYDDGRLLVGAPANPTTVGWHGVALFDVSDPADPTLTKRHPTFDAVHNCFLRGRFAYVAQGSGMDVVDVGREDPAKVGEWRPEDHDADYRLVSLGLKPLHDLYVQGDRAYLANWDIGTFVLDVSDPTEPTHLATIGGRSADELEEPENPSEGLEPPGNDHYVRPNGDGSLLAVGKESWDSDPDDDTGGPSGIALWDVSDLDAPEQVATIEPPEPPAGERAVRSESLGYWTTSHNFDIYGEYLYSSWYQGGVRIHDVSDPSSPSLVAGWEDGERASFWTAQVGVPGEFFVASDEGAYDSREGGLYTFPDPTGVSATPTPEPTATYTFTPTPTPSPTPTPTDTPTATPTDSPTPTATATDSPTPTDTPTATDTPGASGPGFGPFAALAGLGLGAWRLLGGDGGEGGDGDA